MDKESAIEVSKILANLLGRMNKDLGDLQQNLGRRDDAGIVFELFSMQNSIAEAGGKIMEVLRPDLTSQRSRPA